jgi:hypothetical protein
MDQGVKRATNISKGMTSTSNPKQPRGLDPLFEAEWDEFVIRFDARSQEYKIQTARQPQETCTDKLTSEG